MLSLSSVFLWASISILSSWMIFCEAHEAFQEAALKKHNEYRARHGKVPPLKLDSKLNEEAMKCAQLYLDKSKIDHSCKKPKDTGENLYASGASNANFVDLAKSAVDAWYSEVKIYDFKNVAKEKAIKSGHFTQVVWKSSKTMGFGVATKSKFSVAVGLYQPSGNMYYDTSFKNNVLAPDGARGREGDVEAQNKAPHKRPILFHFTFVLTIIFSLKLAI